MVHGKEHLTVQIIQLQQGNAHQRAFLEVKGPGRQLICQHSYFLLRRGILSYIQVLQSEIKCICCMHQLPGTAICIAEEGSTQYFMTGYHLTECFPESGKIQRAFQYSLPCYIESSLTGLKFIHHP